MKKYWWKILSILLLLYVIIAGFLIRVPHLVILHETVRNLFFHVPMWMAMFTLFSVSFICAILYLRKGEFKYDIAGEASASVGLVFGVIGLVTGAVWAKFTWGQFWSNDPKQLYTGAALLIYFAYFVLRNSFTDIDNRAKVAAVYNIFAFALLIPLTIVIPRITDSLHPGNGGNPGFDIYDSTGHLKEVLYPAFIGWTLLGCWCFNLAYRFKKLRYKKLFQKL